MASQPIPRLTEEEYLAIERAADYKSEFVGGELFAMAGGRFDHQVIASNLTAEFVLRLRGSQCRTVNSDMRVRTPATGSHCYPDLAVVCGQPRFRDDRRDVLVNPILIAEVLSPSTANYDRSVKFELYREFDTLQEYVLVHQDERRIEHYHRQDDGAWLFREYRGAEALVPVPSLEIELPLAAIYEGALDVKP